ncbi:MAG: zinc ABC transporter substrate-binding protein [Pseudomonadota bacterium]
MRADRTTFGGLLRTFACGATLMIGTGSTALAADSISVVTSIKPVHSLVASVMSGVGTPSLIVEGAGSPHTYALKPSQAQALEKADVVFWIGHEIETFLEKPVETLGKKARVVELMDTEGLVKLKLREGGAFEAHAHDDHDDHDDHAEKTKAAKDHDDHDHGHDHDDHADAKHDDHDDHAKTKKTKAGQDDHGHDDHAHGSGEDAHIWLDPANAKVMVSKIAATLAAADARNAAAYKANAKALTARLDALVANVQATVKPVQGRGFIVFHDAYHYFEDRFGLEAAGAISVNPEVLPGASRVAEIKAKVNKLGATCVFAEPQFEPKLVNVVTEGTKAKKGVLDPLGASIENGPDLYFTLIENLGRSFSDCLSSAS